MAIEVLHALQLKSYKSKYAIAKDLKMLDSSVRGAVDHLVEHGLAIHSRAEGLYYAEPVSNDALLTLSIRLQKNGRAEMQRIKYKIDREIFLNQNLHVALKNCGEA